MKTSSIACAALAAGCAVSPAPLPDSSIAASLAAAEQAFAAQSVRENTRAAFLANFAEDGMLLVGGEWAPAIPALRDQVPAPRVLDWRPAYVEAARAGDLGLSTGPWKITPRDSAKPPLYGQFVSVWRHQDAGWKVVADIGISHREAALWERPLEMRVADAASAPGNAASLEEAETQLAGIAAQSGERAALRRYGDDGLRLYREGSAPCLGLAAALGATGVGDTPRTFTVQARQVSRSGDIAYARGTYA